MWSKEVLPQPSAMNFTENKEKRSNYVGSVMESIGHVKHCVHWWNCCNLFLRRTFGRSKKGVRQFHFQLLPTSVVLPQPSAMNWENKEKRSNYVGSVMESIGQKRIVYIDQTNCNLFLRRSFGRSKKGVKTVSLPTSKGQNVHVIAG